MINYISSKQNEISFEMKVQTFNYVKLAVPRSKKWLLNRQTSKSFMVMKII